MGEKLPEGWAWKRLGDVATVGAGNSAPQGEQYFTDGTYPFVRTKDAGREKATICLVNTTDKVNNFAVKECKLKLLPAKTLIVPKSGASTFLNHRALLGEPSYVSSHLATVIACNDLLPEYLYFWSLTIDAKQLTHDINYPSLRLSELGSAKIPLPPLETQRKIVAILEKADETKRLRMQADELTSQLLQSVFLEMFGDPVKNPKGWEMVKLGDFGDWTSGGTPSRTKPEYFQGNIPWFTAGELNDSYLLNSKERITEEALEVSAAKIFPKETMLIGMYDTAAFKMGLLLHPASSNQACAAFIPKKEELDSLFALHLFKAMKPVFLSKRRGVRQKNLSQTIIKNFEVPLPPFSLQTEFRQIVERVEKMRQNQKQTQQEIDNLFNTLMQKAFKGELVA